MCGERAKEMAAVPVAKVASLLVRTLAKPIATKLKKEAGRHPFLSKTSQVIGQQLHSITSRINVNTAGLVLFQTSICSIDILS